MLTFSVNPNLYAGYEKINLQNMPKTDKGREWLGAVWLKAHTLKSNLDTDAYGYKCSENTKLKDNSKYISLLSVDELVGGKVGVAETVAAYFDDNIDDLLERSEIVTISEEFLDMREYLIAEIEVDILFIMDKALEYNKRAMAKLREVAEDFSMFDMVKKVMQPEYMSYIKGVIA